MNASLSAPAADDESAQVAADLARMRELLQRHLIDPAAPAITIQECRIGDVRRRDGSRGTAQYDLVLEDATTGRTWNQMVTGVVSAEERSRRTWESLRAAASETTTNANGLSLPPFAYLPELDMLIQVFPHDRRLPGLARLMTGLPPDLTALLMAEFGPGAWQPAGVTAETVQYRVDMRAIVRLDVRATEANTGQVAERSFFAKIYRDPELARRSHAMHLLLHKRVLAEAGPLAVARPVAFVDPLRAVVTAAMPGNSLARIIRRGDGLEPAVRAAARAVATFHQLDVVAPPRPFAADIARLREAETELGSTWPDLASDVSTIVNAVIGGLAGAPSTLIHGDLKPEHLLIEGERVTLIDFDLIGLADPITDVAHLQAFLGKAQERSRARGVEPAQIFVDEYFAHTPDAWRSRLHLYHAMASMHIAVGLCRRRGEGGRDAVERVLREGLELATGSSADGLTPSFKRRMTRATAR